MSQPKKTLFMETTAVPADRTAAEISSMLIQAGATQIATDYEDGRIKGLRWSMRASGHDILFQMPARAEPIYAIFLKRNKSTWLNEKQKAEMRAKAERVAWRQLLRWTQAQVAMIECGMTEASEVFFPYMQVNTGQTVYEIFRASEFKMLEGPKN